MSKVAIDGFTDDHQKSMKESTERVKGMKDIIASNGIDWRSFKTLDPWVREDAKSCRMRIRRSTRGSSTVSNIIRRWCSSSSATVPSSVKSHTSIGIGTCARYRFPISHETFEGIRGATAEEVMASALSKAMALAEPGGFELRVSMM